MDPVIIRSFERILDAAIGGIAIYLGYRLFLKLPEKTDSAGKIILPGNISVYLSRVGPGVFFALFGAAVIALSLHHSVQINVEPAKATAVAQGIQQKIAYSGVTADRSAPTPAELAAQQSLMRPSLYWLNQLPTQISGFASDQGRVDMQLQLPAIKLALLDNVWAPDWCAYETFAEWVQRGAGDPVPAGCQQAREMYFYGQE